MQEFAKMGKFIYIEVLDLTTEESAVSKWIVVWNFQSEIFYDELLKQGLSFEIVDQYERLNQVLITRLECAKFVNIDVGLEKQMDEMSSILLLKSFGIQHKKMNHDQLRSLYLETLRSIQDLAVQEKIIRIGNENPKLEMMEKVNIIRPIVASVQMKVLQKNGLKSLEDWILYRMEVDGWLLQNATSDQTVSRATDEYNINIMTWLSGGGKKFAQKRVIMLMAAIMGLVALFFLLRLFKPE